MLITGTVVRIWEYANGETGEVFQKVSLDGTTEAYPKKRIIVKALKAYPDAAAVINGLQLGQKVSADVAPFDLGEKYPWFGAVEASVDAPKASRRK